MRIANQLHTHAKTMPAVAELLFPPWLKGVKRNEESLLGDKGRRKAARLKWHWPELSGGVKGRVINGWSGSRHW